MDEAEQEIAHTLSRLAQSMDRSATAMADSISDLKKEIEDLKESRFKPYFASLGLFVVITLAVTGYVYNLESRMTSSIFGIQNKIASNAAASEVNTERISIHAERALARQEHAMQREAFLETQIKDIRLNARGIAEEVVKHLTAKEPHVERSSK